MPVMVPVSTWAPRGGEQAISSANTAEEMAISLVIHLAFPDWIALQKLECNTSYRAYKGNRRGNSELNDGYELTRGGGEQFAAILSHYYIFFDMERSILGRNARLDADNHARLKQGFVL